MKRKTKLNKTQFIGFVAASVDGRIALDNKTPQAWTSKEDWEFFQDAISRFDAVVVGRTTYENARKRLQKRNTYVFSSKAKGVEKREGVTFVNPEKTDLSAIFAQYGKVAILGGSVAYQTMVDKNLFDEIFVTIEPLIFGRGTEMFVGGKRNTTLKLLSTKRLNTSGTLLLRYAVIKK